MATALSASVVRRQHHQPGSRQVWNTGSCYHGRTRAAVPGLRALAIPKRRWYGEGPTPSANGPFRLLRSVQNEGCDEGNKGCMTL